MRAPLSSTTKAMYVCLFTAYFYACKHLQRDSGAHLFRLFNTHSRDTTDSTQHRQAVQARRVL